MKELLEDILIFSKVAETESASRESVDLNKVLAQVLAEREKKISEKGAVVRTERMPVLNANPLQMRQLLGNLIDNSLQRLDGVASPEIRILSHFGECAAEIRVKDNGAAFDDTDADKIFGPSRTHEEAGDSGIGLAVCRRIVERHGGRISAESRSAGSTFVVALPIGKTAAVA
jgi:signal transduction histidine kinase